MRVNMTCWLFAEMELNSFKFSCAVAIHHLICTNRKVGVEVANETKVVY